MQAVAIIKRISSVFVLLFCLCPTRDVRVDMSSNFHWKGNSKRSVAASNLSGFNVSLLFCSCQPSLRALANVEFETLFVEQRSKPVQLSAPADTLATEHMSRLDVEEFDVSLLDESVANPAAILFDSQPSALVVDDDDTGLDNRGGSKTTIAKEALDNDDELYFGGASVPAPTPLTGTAATPRVHSRVDEEPYYVENMKVRVMCRQTGTTGITALQHIVQNALKHYAHLLPPEEQEIGRQFVALDTTPQRVFMRLYARKGPWFRVDHAAERYARELGPDVALVRVSRRWDTM
jgi:hypothetical protein